MGYSVGGIPTPDSNAPKPGGPDYSGSKDLWPLKWFRSAEGAGIYVGPSSDKDEPYTWGRAKKALKSSLPDVQWCRLLLLKGRIQDRLIDQQIHPEDPDGLCL